jgi:hypothetical protein
MTAREQANLLVEYGNTQNWKWLNVAWTVDGRTFTKWEASDGSYSRILAKAGPNLVAFEYNLDPVNQNVIKTVTKVPWNEVTQVDVYP